MDSESRDRGVRQYELIVRSIATVGNYGGPLPLPIAQHWLEAGLMQPCMRLCGNLACMLLSWALGFRV